MADTSWIGQLNIDQFVKQQMAREQEALQKATQPKIDLLAESQTSYQNQMNLYQQLQQLLPAFQSTVTQLKNAFNPSYQIGYSTSGIADVKVTGDVSPGTHTLEVTKLAQAQRIQSGGTAFSSATDPLGLTETMNFTIGSGSFHVDVAAGDNLQAIATKITNTAKANGYNISASADSTSSGNYRLSIFSTQTGLSNAFSITESGGSALNVTTGSTATLLKSADDAEFKLDSVTYTKSSNNNSINGMNLTLMNTTATSGVVSINLSPTYQNSAIVTATQNMVTAYNQIITTASTAQIQSGNKDPNLGLLLTSLQDQIKSAFGGAGAYAGKGVGAIGIQMSTTPQSVQITLPNGKTAVSYISGLLQVNTSADPAETSSLTNALSSKFSDVQSLLFDSTHGIMTLMSSNVLNPVTGSADRAQKSGFSFAQRELSETTQKMKDMNDGLNDKIKDLKLKYAQLYVNLQSMQDASNFLNAQIQALSGR